MSFPACTEANDMPLVTTIAHTVTSRETVLTVSKNQIRCNPFHRVTPYRK